MLNASNVEGREFNPHRRLQICEVEFPNSTSTFHHCEHPCAAVDTLAGCTLMRAAQTTVLSERDRALLDFEGLWWKIATEKDQLIRERFQMSPAKFDEHLDRLSQLDEAFT